MESTRTELSDKIEWRNELGQIHRLDGPAIEWKSGAKWWYINGLRHREDGPAVEYRDGTKTWYLNGTQYTEEQWNEKILKIKLNRIKDI